MYVRMESRYGLYTCMCRMLSYEIVCARGYTRMCVYMFPGALYFGQKVSILRQGRII